MTDSVHGSACNTEIADGWEYLPIEDGRAVKLIRYRGTASVVTTPEQICGLPVTTLGCQTFTGNPRLTQVRLGDSILKVEDGSGLRKTGAFRSCTGLETVILSSGISRIADYMFYGVSNARYMVLSVDFRNVTEVGDFAFACCNHLIRLKLPACVRKIGTGAFYQARRLASLEMPGVSEIAADAFTETVFEEAYEKRWKQGSFSGIVYADKVAYLYMGNSTVPMGEGMTLTVRDGTLGISEHLFLNPFADTDFCRRNLYSVILPPTVRFVPDDLFNGFRSVRLIGNPGGCIERCADGKPNIQFWPKTDDCLSGSEPDQRSIRRLYD